MILTIVLLDIICSIVACVGFASLIEHFPCYSELLKYLWILSAIVSGLSIGWFWVYLEKKFL